MSDASTTQLNGLSDIDHTALTRLFTESLWRVDHGYGDRVCELYTEDGELCYEGKVFCKGRAAIEEWGNNRREPSSSRHTATNVRFEADGADRGNGSAVIVVYLAEEARYGPAATVPLLVGEAELQCTRTAEGWRVSRSDLHVMFDRREDPGALF